MLVKDRVAGQLLLQRLRRLRLPRCVSGADAGPLPISARLPADRQG